MTCYFQTKYDVLVSSDIRRANNSDNLMFQLQSVSSTGFLDLQLPAQFNKGGNYPFFTYGFSVRTPKNVMFTKL